MGERGKDRLFDNIAIALGDSNKKIANELYYPEIYQTLSDAWSAPHVNKATFLDQFVKLWYESLIEADWH
ncbi:PoNe immunity protein domain-containing protein [Pseudoalteromonas sp. C2R02]|uniref:PoNe immunity protein domain-containing protein n=1 Tax=Pseudoalteromonas sp. C2R02 TaxID=2841565 RepID=UPI00339D44FA